MNILYGTLLAPLADTFGAFQCSAPFAPPPNPESEAPSCPTTPARMRLTNVELGLPFPHTTIVAECTLSMEVALRTLDFLPAPVTGEDFPASAFHVGLAATSKSSTRRRTEAAFTVAAIRNILSALSARTRRRIAPAGAKIAGIGAKLSRWPSVLRMKGRTTLLAIARCIDVPHTAIVTDSERYCEIAAKRMAQAVLPLELP